MTNFEKLWVDWFEKDGDPFYSDGSAEGVYCFFCKAWQNDYRNEPEHKLDCVYRKAKRMIDSSNIPLADI